MRILVLAGKGESTNAVVNALLKKYTDITVVIEDDVPMRTFLYRRIKRLGIVTVAGQLLFMATLPRQLRRQSKGRISQIKNLYVLDDSIDYQKKCDVRFVKSVNHEDTAAIIREICPDIVVVNGTRIISSEILDIMLCPVINMHMGITPKYRGVHGGYWAIVNDDMENCGVTVHLVNAGIDTGDIIKQARIEVTKKDNYVTYPFLQLGEGIRLELEILDDFEKNGKLEAYKTDQQSMLWSHPTIWQYLKNKSRSR